MPKSEILLNVNPFETRIAYLEAGELVDLKMEKLSSPTLVGSIHRGKVIRVLPGMQAAFVDIGLERAAFLYVGDVRDDASILDGNVIVDAEEEKDEVTEFVIKDSPKIQELLQEGQNILVQVAKDPVGTKGARITTHVSLASRRFVYLPTLDHVGISRKIESAEERDRLKKVLEESNLKAGGIIRTAGEGMTSEELNFDIEYLSKVWDRVQEAYDKKTNYGMVYSEIDFELRILRDMLSEDVGRIIVDDEKAFDKIKAFLDEFLPRYSSRLERYNYGEGLFAKYGLEIEVTKALDRKVWLRSGGYLVFDETEALVVVDVNTGKFVGKKDLEDTIFKTNLEAVKEIAHQIRLRDCSGIIVIDFIDMTSQQHRDKILDTLKEEVKKDRVRVSVISMTGLGLVELTRKRLRPSLKKSVTDWCFYCEGAGRLKRRDTILCEIYRGLSDQSKISRQQGPWEVICHPDLTNWIYTEQSELIDKLEEALKETVVFRADHSMHWEDFKISRG